MPSARLALLLFACSILPCAPSFGQPSDSPPPRADSLGLKLTGIPEALYAHLPALERGQGLLVEAIQADSRGAAIGLMPFDIVLAIGTSPVKSAAVLERKLSDLPRGEREILQIIRGGKPFALAVGNPAAAYAPAKSLFKPGGPPTVSVEVKARPAGGMEVNLFYLNQANKMERHELVGSLEQIERQVSDLAERRRMSGEIHDLVGLALQRLRTKPPNGK